MPDEEFLGGIFIMGYSTRKLPNKLKLPHWKLQFISYKKHYSKNSIAKKPRKEWDIRRSHWQNLGFHESMNFDQAKSRVRQLNAQLEIKKQEEKRRSLEEEELFFKTKFMAAMPEVTKMNLRKNISVADIEILDGNVDFGSPGGLHSACLQRFNAILSIGMMKPICFMTTSVDSNLVFPT
jgi:hypothetical protein